MSLLRQYMEKYGIGVRELARACDRSPAFISKLCEDAARPSHETASDIIQAIPLEDFEKFALVKVWVQPVETAYLKWLAVFDFENYGKVASDTTVGDTE